MLGLYLGLGLTPITGGGAPFGMQFLYDIDGSLMLDIDGSPMFEPR